MSKKTRQRIKVSFQDTSTFGPRKLRIEIRELAKKVLKFQKQKLESRQLINNLNSQLLIGDYKTVAIFLYKSKYMRFTYNELLDFLERKSNLRHTNSALYLNFKKQLRQEGKTMPLTMYIIKNDHVFYTKDGRKIKDPISLRKQKAFK
jgi:hypothetical protein